jgi:hypothetical protein
LRRSRSGERVQPAERYNQRCEYSGAQSFHEGLLIEKIQYRLFPAATDSINGEGWAAKGNSHEMPTEKLL